MIVRYIGAPVSPDSSLITSVFPPQREAAKHILSGKCILVKECVGSEYLFENCGTQFSRNLFKEVPDAVVAHKYLLLINAGRTIRRSTAGDKDASIVTLWFPYLLNDSSLDGWVTAVNKIQVNTNYVIMTEKVGTAVVRLNENNNVEVLEVIEVSPKKKGE